MSIETCYPDEQTSEDRLLVTLERLLGIQATAIKPALDQASGWVAEAMGADKVEAFLYEAPIDSLVAVGASDTPMGRRQRRLGLDRLPLSNGGVTVEVYRTDEPYYTGRADLDPRVITGVVEGLGVRSMLAVPLQIGGERRGVLEVVSSRPDCFSMDDLPFTMAVARWVGLVAQRAELVERLTREAGERARRLAAEELIHMLAHDLRTPLTPARGHLDLLRRRAAREGRLEDVRSAENIAASLDRLGSMIVDILDAGRLEQGLFALILQPVDLAALARQTAGALQTPDRGEIEVRSPEKLVLERADPGRLRQALENLIGNALAHGPAGAPVAVELATELRQGGEWAVLRVCDQGPGIAPDLLPALFERFARGPESTGLGLGLYLARGIAQAHGGTLTVESQPGEGTMFSLALPRAGAARAS
ncbi:MAG TPA: GAF domain-containing sensor histidine kinase [Chloroflexota bacterium]|nr:GAF domain-containing sensor histidine kinase [Chloroflexota bacterium]